MSNMKLFIDLCNWNGIKYATVINNNILERKNLEIALLVLYGDLEPIIDFEFVNIDRSDNRMCPKIFIQEKNLFY